MAAKLLRSLTDENHQELQKQIGCMTGIFQIFDRQHILTSGGRRIVAHTPKRLRPPGNSHFSSGTLEREPDNTHPISASVEQHSQKNTQERQRVSSESSRASFSSSSHSSSFSSLDCNRATRLEPASFDRMIFPETPSRDPSMSLKNSSPQFSRQSLDLRDLVKESMYREIQVKPKTSDGSHDIKQSMAGKLQEAPRYHNEPRQLLRSSSYNSKDGSSSFSVSKDTPRFSYDGRDLNRTPFDPRDDFKSILKLKDLPRLSLDSSREGSMRSLNADSKSNFWLKSMQEIQARPPSLVARLMGLETLPDSFSFADTNGGSSRSYLDEEDFVNNISSSFEKTDPRKPIQLSSSSKKEPSSPRWRNPDSLMKPMSRIPIEPAPWKQIDVTKSSQKPASSRSTRGTVKGPTTFPSVYSEIEKRLKDLEFTQSGKDLRALKQILEAMQAKGLLETPKEGQGSNFTSRRDHEQKKLSSTTRSLDKRNPQIEQVLDSKRRASCVQNYDSPIVIMKPAKLVEKSSIPTASVISLNGGLSCRGGEFVDNRKGISSGRTSKDPIFKSSQRENAVSMKYDRTLKTTHTLTRSQPLAKDGNPGPGKSTGSISPRMQQKKLELEKRSRPPTPPDSSKLKRQSNKQQAESDSPGGGRRRLKHRFQQSDDQLSENTSSERSPGELVEKKSILVLNEEGLAESGFVPSEYSSPVSVLDNVVSKNESPSPPTNKYVGKTLQVDKERDSNGVDGISVDSNSMASGATFKMNRKKLENISKLVQKLRKLNSSHDEARTDYIASLCENTDPDYRYVSEILLASGLLLRESLTDFQFHPSGHPLNPELFLVLEQTKASAEVISGNCTQLMMISEKFHRKLIFDSVNEILSRKLTSPGQYWLSPVKLARKTLNAQKLLRELCSEIEGLQASNPKCSSDEEDERWKNILCEDVMDQSESWINFDGEISDAVLDIERSIFKDLVSEIVNGESAGLKTKLGRRRLFVA